MSRANVALKLRLAPEARKKLAALAAWEGLTESDWVSLAIFNASAPPPTLTPARTRLALAKARREAQGRRA